MPILVEALPKLIPTVDVLIYGDDVHRLRRVVLPKDVVKHAGPLPGIEKDLVELFPGAWSVIDGRTGFTKPFVEAIFYREVSEQGAVASVAEHMQRAYPSTEEIETSLNPDDRHVADTVASFILKHSLQEVLENDSW